MTKGNNTFSINFGASMKALRFLTILLTTFSLYAVQTFVAQPAYAQSQQGNGLPSISENNDNDDGGFFSGGAGANVGLDGKEKTGNEKAGVNLNMILLLVAVMAAPMFVMYCSERIDAWIYSATAAVYIGMEIANWVSYKAQSERDMKAKRTADLKGNQEQQESLMEAAKQTANAAEAAERRAKAAKIAAMGYGAAGAIALVMSILHSPPVCGMSGSTCDQYKCKEADAEWTPEPTPAVYNQRMYLEADKEFELVAKTDFGNLENYLNSAENDEDFVLRIAEVNRYKKGATSSMQESTAKVISETFEGYESESKFITAFKTIGYNIADLILPKAQAAGGGKLAALGMGAAGVYAVFKMGKPFMGQIKRVMNFGFSRSAFHFVAAGMAGVVAKDASAAARQLNGRAAQYRELATKLGMSSVSTANHGLDINTMEIGSASLTAVDKKLVDQGRTCFTGSKGKLNEDTKCACLEAKNCKKSEIPKLSTMSQVSIPNAIKTSTSSLGAAGNSLFSGDLGGALSESNAAGSNALRLRKLSIGLKKKANVGFVGAGGKPIDFGKMESSLRNSLIKAAVSDIKNLTVDAKSALAGRFPGVFGDGADVEKDPNADIKVGDTAVKTGAVASAKGSSSSKAKDPMAGFAFDIEDSEDVSEPVASNTIDSLGGSEDQVELDREDITGDRNKNIFSLITKRYFKTAYPRFFEARE